MHKLTMPTILIATVLVAGIFAFMPIEKAITVHTTIQGTQLNEFASVFVTDTEVGNATAGCGTGNAGVVYWTVFNSSLGDANTSAGGTTVTTTTFKLTTDGDTEDGDEIDITLASNYTSASGVVSIAGTTASDLIIGAPGTGSSRLEQVGDILVSIQCQSGDVAAASSVTP